VGGLLSEEMFSLITVVILAFANVEVIMKIRFPNKRTLLLIAGLVSTLALSFILILSPSISVSFASNRNVHLTGADADSANTAIAQDKTDIAIKQAELQNSSSNNNSNANNQNSSGNANANAGNQSAQDGSNGAGDACG